MTDLQYLEKYYNGDIIDGMKRLKNGEPIQYIIGNVNFYGNIIDVSKDVLIPRFETEQLIEKTVIYIKKYLSEKIKIVDIGTGSGCIAVTLKKIFPESEVAATDISNKALKMAKNNIEKHQLEIDLYHGDMLNPLTKKYDVIISNPPYIAYDETIMDIVKNNEPNIALYADNNGLKYYEEILSKADKYLNKKNIIAFEIGDKQALKIKNIAKKTFPNCKISIEKDLQGLDRFIFIFNL